MKDINEMSIEELRHEVSSSRGRTAPLQQQNARLTQELAAKEEELIQLRATNSKAAEDLAYKNNLEAFEKEHPDWDMDVVKQIVGLARSSFVAPEQPQQNKPQQQQNTSNPVREYMLAHDTGLTAFVDKSITDTAFSNWLQTQPHVSEALQQFNTTQDAGALAYFGGIMAKSVSDFEKTKMSGEQGTSSTAGIGANIKPTQGGVEIRNSSVDNSKKSELEIERDKINAQLAAGGQNMMQRSNMYNRRMEIDRQLAALGV